jgi:hypothetical protein
MLQGSGDASRDNGREREVQSVREREIAPVKAPSFTTPSTTPAKGTR